MLITKIENTYYSRRMYTQSQNSVFQAPAIYSWSNLRGKNVQVSAGLTSSRTAFRNGNQIKNLGLKIECDFAIS